MSTVPDDFSPVSVGDTLIPFSPAFKTLDSTGKVVPFPLSGLTLSMKMQSEKGDIKTCNGPWTTVDAPGGLAQYQWQAGDVDTAGRWKLFVRLTNGGGAFVHGETKTIEVLSAP